MSARDDTIDSIESLHVLLCLDMFTLSRFVRLSSLKRSICTTNATLARHLQAKEREHESESTKNDLDIPVYEKAMDRNNQFKKMMTNLSIRSRREKMNLICFEGLRMINDAVACGVNIKSIYFTMKEHLRDIDHLDHLVNNQQTRLVRILHKDMKTFSSLVTPTSMVAVAEKPSLQFVSTRMDGSSLMPALVICDNVRDPGNLGTILRTCAAAGVTKVLLTTGCVDAWNAKTLKAGCGAHFRLAIHTDIAWSDMPSHLPDQLSVYLAECKQPSATNPALQELKYYNVEFYGHGQAQQSKLLIIGNEGSGISRESYQLASKHNATVVHIPLYNNVESLNSAIASSILIYEMRRQFDLL